MASSISAFACTIPAGTDPFNPVTVPLNVNSVDPVESIHWRVPPGSRGHVGWWLTQSGVQVLPNKFGTNLVADGESDTWQLSGFPESDTWALEGYNTGANDHVIYLEFAHQTAGATLTGIVEGPVPPGWPLSDGDIPGAWTVV